MHGAIAQERPPHLATDTAATDPVLAHVVRNMAGYRPDLVVLLQPTVPVRRAGLVDDCIQRLQDTDADCVFTARALPYVWWREDKGSWVDYADWRTNNPGRLRRQDLPPQALHWEEDGSVYVTRVEFLCSSDAASKYPPRRIGGRVQAYPNERTVDVDTLEDLAWVDARLSAAQEVA
jgi:CMP-N-acetylneuraminic acid synthetase